MKVYIVIEDTWGCGGKYSAVHRVFSSEESAIQEIRTLNKKVHYYSEYSYIAEEVYA